MDFENTKYKIFQFGDREDGKFAAENSSPQIRTIWGQLGFQFKIICTIVQGVPQKMLVGVL